MTARALCIAALSFAFAHQVYAAQPRQYVRHSMALSGPLLDLVADDMDGDGLRDVVAVSLGGDGKRVVELFHQKGPGGFPGRPDASWEMPPSAVAFDTGDVTGSPGRSVCFLAPDGMYAFLPRTKGGGYETKAARLISAASVFTNPDPLDMPRWPFMAESEDGTVALIPGISGLGVYERRGGAFVSVSEPRLHLATTFSGGRGEDGTLTVSHRVPVVSVTGFNRPGGSDIVMSWDDNAVVHLRGDDGRYKTPPDISFTPGLLVSRGKDPLEGAWLLPADIDGDGRLDFVVAKKAGGLAHTRSLVFVYVRKPGGQFPAKPDDTIITEGVVGPRFLDIDGDGRLDILIPSIKVGVSNFINMLTSGSVNVNIDIYVQKPSGGFPDRPTGTKSVKFKLDLANIAKAVPVLETGRFTDGGGYGLAVVSGEDSVSVYLPDRYSLLSDRPGIELEVDAPTEMAIEDLNGDGADDFVLTYKRSEALSGVVNIFLSR